MAAMTLTSTAFAEGERIPTVHTADGADTSPPLAWTDPPAGTKSLAVLCADPDAPRGTWVHWVLFNLPPAERGLAAGVAKSGKLPNAVQGTTDFGSTGYGGPSPPPGKPHRYFFTVYALDTVLSLDSAATRAHVLDAMKGHILAEGQLMGVYGR
jgi:Raf kinase inhibitor-like YbhB/YbcL family protein